MSNRLLLLKLHLKTQWIWYLAPAIFLYSLIIPYQTQFLGGNIDEEAVKKVMDSAQEILLLIGIWYQYLGFRMLLSPELRELSYGNRMKSKTWWELNCIGLFFIIIASYLSWLVFQLNGYEECIITLAFQCIIMQVFLFWLMHLCRSSLAGMAIGAAYYFCNINQLLPSYISIARVGVLPKYYAKEWYIVQIGFIILFVIMTIWMEKTQYIYMRKK